MSSAPELSRNLLKEVSMKFRAFSSRAVAATATAVLLVVTLVCAIAAFGQVSQKSKVPDPRTPDGQPDLQGIWNTSTVTPMERPRDLEGKEFFASEAEASAYEKAATAKSEAGLNNGIGSYGDLYYEFGTKTVKTRRTSFIVDPPDGRVPPLTPTAQAAWEREQAIRRRRPNGPEDRPTSEQCVAIRTGVPPMTPWAYNSNYRIVQSKNQVAIYIEMIHDVRIIPLDGRPHLPSSIHLWYGDSVGHWEGNTLVVDTTNLSGKTGFYGADENLHVIERFSRMDADTLLYQFTVDDPSAFTKIWKGELTMSAAPGPIVEYACNEGNYALAGILGGARADDKAEEAALKAK
jgi:hypothetical protein